MKKKLPILAHMHLCACFYLYRSGSFHFQLIIHVWGISKSAQSTSFRYGPGYVHVRV